MNYWTRIFAASCWRRLGQWDFLLINDSEARLLSGEQNLRRAAAKILGDGPHTLVINAGDKRRHPVPPRLHFMAHGYLLETVFRPDRPGDSFAGGFIGYLAGRGIELSGGEMDVAELRRAVMLRVVMSSFCCEQSGWSVSHAH